jgi:hypothetical protein
MAPAGYWDVMAWYVWALQDDVRAACEPMRDKACRLLDTELSCNTGWTPNDWQDVLTCHAAILVWTVHHPESDDRKLCDLDHALCSRLALIGTAEMHLRRVRNKTA